MPTRFCLLVFCLVILQPVFAQQTTPVGFNTFPPGSAMASQQQHHFQEFTRSQQKMYQAKIDSIVALRQSYSQLSTNGRRTKAGSTTLRNTCNLQANCSPEQDTTVATSGPFTLKNTTVGADSYEWVDHSLTSYPTKPGQDLVIFPQVGVSHVQLIAHRGNCTDTADRYIVFNGTPPLSNENNAAVYGQPAIDNVVQCLAADPTDGYLLAGTSGGDPFGNVTGSGYFVRVSENGCVLWSRLIRNTRVRQIVSVVPLNGGGFAALAKVEEQDASLLIYCFDVNGNIVWTKSIIGQNSIGLSGMKVLSDGSFLLLGQSSTTLYGQLFAARLDAAGNFMWQHRYAYIPEDQGFFTDAVENNGQLYLVGWYSQQTLKQTQAGDYIRANYPILANINLASGNIDWLKTYASPSKIWYPTRINLYKGGLLISGIADSVHNAIHLSATVLVDVGFDGTPRDAKLLWFGGDGSISTVRTIVQPDNSLSVMYSGTASNPLGLQGWFSETYYMRLDQQKNILWSKNFGGQGTWWTYDAVRTPNGGMAMATMKLGGLIDFWPSYSMNYLLIKSDATGSLSYACHEWIFPGTAQDMVVADSTMTIAPAINCDFSKQDRSTGAAQPRSEVRFVCPDYVPFCSFMNVTGPKSVCNMSQTYDYIAHKDPSCGDPVYWEYDHSKIRTVNEDGAKTSLQFLEPGVFIVKAKKPFPCVDIIDSVIVTVSPALAQYTLGNDTTLCAGNTLLVRPKGKYDSFLWQDNSTADSFLVRTAGTYRCTVTDSCGNQKTDELIVNYHTPWTLTAASPITKCPADTVLLPTTPGLHSVSWYPANQVINTLAGLPGAIARTTTDYILTGKDQFECPVKDHWLLSIWPTPVISLGADTTICPEGSAVLVAPAGFSSYLWSTGLLSRQINTSMPGKYWVFATDAHGCHASDSIQVKTFTSPLPKIIGNTWICRGQPTELNAGNFSSYLWQDGSQQQFLTVSDTGYYHVSVTDTHHCSASADLHIATVQELPARFLPSDTSVCTGFFTVLSALRSYNKYVWSTGETGASIKVSQAGRYQLKVMNEKGCVGVDSCLVVSKDCEAKIWFPNAFTPNGDGNNDIFRLKFPGHAANYHLEIFNRWGQRIFNSNDPSAGWNGDTSGQKQPAGIYIWMVHWSSLDGVAQQKKGSVVLIR